VNVIRWEPERTIGIGGHDMGKTGCRDSGNGNGPTRHVYADASVTGRELPGRFPPEQQGIKPRSCHGTLKSLQVLHVLRVLHVLHVLRPSSANSGSTASPARVSLLLPKFEPACSQQFNRY